MNEFGKPPITQKGEAMTAREINTDDEVPSYFDERQKDEAVMLNLRPWVPEEQANQENKEAIEEMKELRLILLALNSEQKKLAATILKTPLNKSSILDISLTIKGRETALYHFLLSAQKRITNNLHFLRIKAGLMQELES